MRIIRWLQKKPEDSYVREDPGPISEELIKQQIQLTREQVEVAKEQVEVAKEQIRVTQNSAIRAAIIAAIGLAVPIIAVLISFNNQARLERDQAELERELVATNAASDREITLDGVLQAYIDRMTQLLLEENLSTSEFSSEVRTIATARTLTTLRELDSNRRGSLLRFIYEAGLISAPEQITGTSIINLREADLRNADLREANLSRADLREAELTGADLREAELTGASLREADLREADLTGANLRNADLRNADLRNADLTGANLRDASLRNTDLREANLRWANLREVDLRNADLREADLTGADLRNADLSRVFLFRANLRGVRFDDTTQIHDKWRLVWEIVNQSATGRDLSKVNLSGANLRDADLSGANLRDADLRWTNLTGADLRGANLSRSNLRDADLRGAFLRGAYYDNDTKWPEDFDPQVAGAVKVDE